MRVFVQFALLLFMTFVSLRSLDFTKRSGQTSMGLTEFKFNLTETNLRILTTMAEVDLSIKTSRHSISLHALVFLFPYISPNVVWEAFCTYILYLALRILEITISVIKRATVTALLLKFIPNICSNDLCRLL